MKNWKRVILAMLCLGMIVGTTACGMRNSDTTDDNNKKDGVVDDVGDTAGDVIDDIGNGVKDTTEDIGNGVKDTTEDITGNDKNKK